MSNKIKGLVSKKKKRYQQEGFDLDLTYITHRVIAMGFPAQNLEGLYRNHVDDVVSLFKKRHQGHYRIYNLCNERQIDVEKFESGSINEEFPFNDHNPPGFLQMIKCCESITSFTNQNIENVVAVQCKAGKGRTGVIICCYLLSIKHSPNATEVLSFYGHARTTNGKGVTIPSQIRYVYYFEHYLKNKLCYEETELRLNNIYMEEKPFVLGNGYELQVIVYKYDDKHDLKELYNSQVQEIKKDGQRSMLIRPNGDWILKGDLKFQFIVRTIFAREKLCHCWLNTFFIVNKPPITSFIEGENQKLSKIDLTRRKRAQVSPDISLSTSPSHNNYWITLQKFEIDKANKDENNRTFPKNFTITFVFEPYQQPEVPNNIPHSPYNSPDNSDIESESSSESSTKQTQSDHEDTKNDH